MTKRLFISHASEDEAVVNRIVAYLEAHGVECWVSSRDIPPQAVYAEAIAEGIQGCTACAVIVSAAANSSKAVKRELELASHADKPFIPIRIDATEPGLGLDYYLRNVQWIDHARNGNHALDRLVAWPTRPQWPEGATPFIGRWRGTLTYNNSATQEWTIDFEPNGDFVVAGGNNSRGWWRQDGDNIEFSFFQPENSRGPDFPWTGRMTGGRMTGEARAGELRLSWFELKKSAT